MNTLLVAIVAATIAGSATGYVAYDRLVVDEAMYRDYTKRCVLGPDAGPGSGNGILRFAITNEGPDQDVLVCALDGDGNKIAQRTVHLNARSLTYVDLATPLASVFGELDYGQDREHGMHRTLSQLPYCAKGAAILRFTLFDGGGSGGGDDACTSRDAPDDGESAQQSILLVGGGGDMGAIGPAAGVGLGAALLVGLVVYNGSRFHYLALLLFSRVAKDRALDLEARQRIHQLVASDPGIHASAIGDRLDLAHGQLLYHLHVLVRERLVSRVGGIGTHNYFPHGKYAPGQMRAMAALRSPGHERVYDAVKANPGQPLSRIAAHAGLSLSRASRVSRRLESAGLVERRAAGREVFLLPRASALPQ